MERLDLYTELQMKLYHRFALSYCTTGNFKIQGNLPLMRLLPFNSGAPVPKKNYMPFFAPEITIGGRKKKTPKDFYTVYQSTVIPIHLFSQL